MTTKRSKKNPLDVFYEKLQVTYLNLSLLVLICIGIGSCIAILSRSVGLIFVSLMFLGIGYLIAKRLQE